MQSGRFSKAWRQAPDNRCNLCLAGSSATGCMTTVTFNTCSATNNLMVTMHRLEATVVKHVTWHCWIQVVTVAEYFVHPYWVHTVVSCPFDGIAIMASLSRQEYHQARRPCSTAVESMLDWLIRDKALQLGGCLRCWAKVWNAGDYTDQAAMARRPCLSTHR